MMGRTEITDAWNVLVIKRGEVRRRTYCLSSRHHVCLRIQCCWQSAIAQMLVDNIMLLCVQKLSMTPSTDGNSTAHCMTSSIQIYLTLPDRVGVSRRSPVAASVDPEVIIRPGTVFEQLSVKTAQNLAVAREWCHTINANEIVGAIPPAFCLNRHLAPPSGQPVRLPPLDYAGAIGSQQAVWDDVLRRRRSLP